MQTIENTVASWSGVLSDLAAKRQHARDRVAELRRRKEEISLESAMGSEAARKELTKINGELTRLTLESDDWDSAIARAEAQKADAQKAEAEAAEQRRKVEMKKLAEEAVLLAKEFDIGLRHACEAGAQLAVVLTSMQAQVKGEHELAAINRLSSRGPYQRACENAGLRRYVEMQAYPGLKKDVQPLAVELTALLDQWLQPLAGGKE
jgi:hypothetical protein